jgi:hypothetical protein
MEFYHISKHSRAPHHFTSRLRLTSQNPQISPREYHIALWVTVPHLILALCPIPPSRCGAAVPQALRADCEAPTPGAPLPSVESRSSLIGHPAPELGCWSRDQTIQSRFLKDVQLTFCNRPQDSLYTHRVNRKPAFGPAGTSERSIPKDTKSWGQTRPGTPLKHATNTEFY